MTTTTNTKNLPHEVPARVGQTVEITDCGHSGTRVTKTNDGRFKFENIDDVVTRYSRVCYLVQLSDEWESCVPGERDAIGWNLDDGLVLTGYEPEPEFGKILWSSEAEKSYEEYAARFDTAEERVEFESQCLAVGDEFLPEIARKVRDEEVEYAPAEYWRWLCSQIEEGE